MWMIISMIEKRRKASQNTFPVEKIDIQHYKYEMQLFIISVIYLCISVYILLVPSPVECGYE